MPTERSEIAAAALDGKIYVAGGLIVTGISGDFQVYDVGQDRWRNLAPLPVRLHHAALAAVAGRLYLTGGYTGLTFKVDQRATWSYDPAADAWRSVAQMPGPRSAHAAAEIGGKLYVVGGVGPHAEALWAYDPKADRWDTSLARLPTRREHLAATVLDGKLYVLGGRDGRGNRATNEVYDPVHDRWDRLRDMALARSGFAAGAVGGRIHVAGGEELGTGSTIASHEAYDASAGSWRSRPDLPEARHGVSSAVVEGRWYVIGGAAKAGWMTLFSMRDTVEFFTPHSNLR